MKKTYTLEASNECILVNGEAMNQENFSNFLKEGLNHQIVYPSGEVHTFAVDKGLSGNLEIQFPCACPCSFDFYFQSVLSLLTNCGSHATLNQDTYWADKQK